MERHNVKTTVVSYTIGADDVIREVSPTWNDFARENFAVRLTEEDVVGRPLWYFITDESTRRLYQVLLDSLRSKKRELSFPFRCDSPRVRRYMVMNVTPGVDDSVTFRNELVEIRPRNPEVYFQHKADASDDYYVMCSVCNKVRPWDSENWQEVEDAFADLADVEDPVKLVYEVCEPCNCAVHSTLEEKPSLQGT